MRAKKIVDELKATTHIGWGEFVAEKYSIEKRQFESYERDHS